jgi:hypothetical protein
MAILGQKYINIGAQNQTSNSDSLYVAFNKIQDNFSNLFSNSSPYNNFVGNVGISTETNAITGTVTITNTGVTKINPGTGISLSGGNGEVTISVTGDANGNLVAGVTRVGILSNSLTVNGSPIVSSGNISLEMPKTGVTAGQYTAPTMTIDEYGRVTQIQNTISTGTVTSVAISPGTGIAVAGSPITSNGVITIVNTGVTRLNPGTGITLSGSNGNITISAGITQDIGTVTRVGISSNTLTVSGGSITTQGNITVELKKDLTVEGNISGNNISWDSGNSKLTVNGVLVSAVETDLGNVDSVKILGGTNGQVLQTDGFGNLHWTTLPTPEIPTAVVAGGGNRQIQFNDGGTFGAHNKLTYNKSFAGNAGLLSASYFSSIGINSNTIIATSANISTGAVSGNLVVGQDLLVGDEIVAGRITVNQTANVTGNLNVTGFITASTPIANTTNAQVATTAFVAGAINNAVVSKANINSPAFTGIPTAPTANISSAGSTQIATTEYVKALVNETVISPVSGSVIPSGVIVMWSGSQSTIPAGWKLCDGTSGTPNLRDRFVIGAGSAYNVAATGGSANAVVVSHSHTANSTFTGASLPTHTHTVTDYGHSHGVNDPGHNHEYRIGQGAGTLSPTIGGWNFVGTFPGTRYPGFIQPTNTGISVNNSTTSVVVNPSVGGIPTGTVSTTVETTGESGVNKNLPPYYALCYIMKT